MKLMTDEELSELMVRADAAYAFAQNLMGELIPVLEKRNEEETFFVGAIDHGAYTRAQNTALGLYELAHQVLVDVEQRAAEHMDIFEKAVNMVTLSFQIMSSSEVAYRRHCIQKGVTITKVTDFVRIPRQTLSWWRQLVDANPSDLVPRMDAYLKEGA